MPNDNFEPCPQQPCGCGAYPCLKSRTILAGSGFIGFQSNDPSAGNRRWLTATAHEATLYQGTLYADADYVCKYAALTGVPSFSGRQGAFGIDFFTGLPAVRDIGPLFRIFPEPQSGSFGTPETTITIDTVTIHSRDINGNGHDFTWILSDEYSTDTVTSAVIKLIAAQSFSGLAWGSAYSISNIVGQFAPFNPAFNEVDPQSSWDGVDVNSLDWSRYDGQPGKILPAGEAPFPASYAQIGGLGPDFNNAIVFNFARSQVLASCAYALVTWIVTTPPGQGIVYARPICIQDGIANGVDPVEIPIPSLNNLPADLPFAVGRITRFVPNCNCANWKAQNP